MLELALRHLSELRSLRQASRVYRFILLLPLAAILSLPTPTAQAQGGCEYVMTHPAGHDLYVQVPEDNIITESPTTYLDQDCKIVDPLSLTEPPWFLRDGLVSAPNAETAWTLCQSINRGPILQVRKWAFTDSIYMCWAASADAMETAAETESGEESRSRGCGTGLDLPLTGLRLHAYDGMDSGIQFRRLDHCGVGIKSVIDIGFLDAVDIWGNTGSGYDVCFPQIGRIVFLDAATSPRSVVFPEYRFDGGWTCASMNRAGTMVLVKGPAGTVAQTSPTTRRPGTEDSIDDAIKLEDCAVTPRVNLRLRAAPWGKILDVVPRDTEVAAKARTKSWFNVMYLEQDGWSAAWLADSEGECEREIEEAEPTPTTEE